ncbi:nickel-dependent lactate racemase, partial [bacterium]|nr:nickel-dependent lactate racemase [bacterium]
MEVKTIQMPFGRGYLDIKIPEKNFQKIYSFKEPSDLTNEEKEIEISLRKPIQSKPLSSIIGSRDKVCILISDITRPVPSDKIVSAILKQLGNISRKNITGVIATGLHRKNTKDELENILGNYILNEIKVTNHDAFDNKKLIHIGITSRGTELFINNYVMNSDKIIMTGYIEPHEFAGFTGGRKSLLPGVSGADTINYNHRLENLDHPKAKIGILEGNPIHEDM